MCECYQNWIGSDCSLRLCPFGHAFVDTPLGEITTIFTYSVNYPVTDLLYPSIIYLFNFLLSSGDLDASSSISGPSKTILYNSQIYPNGIQEQYPDVKDSIGNVLTNSAHMYRECSNRGNCDRTSGECSCLEGFEGSACQRTSCYFSDSVECSGHGLCLNAEELAKLDGNNVYNLWDAKITHGCYCDNGYTGFDCSYRTCKVGSDPIFVADEYSSIRYSNWSYAIVTDNEESNIVGNYSIIFYDYSGENWETGPINYDATCSELTSVLERLPNNVIKKDSILCVKYSDYNNLGRLEEPTLFDPNPFYGVKYTLAFPSNVGKLKQIELNKYLDGKRPTLLVDNSSASLNVFIYPDGFTGENIEYFDERCDGVDVTIQQSDTYHYMGDLTSLEVRLLSKCLGDTDGNDDIYDAKVTVLGGSYSWDYGSVYNPHIVRLVDMTASYTTDLCLGSMNSERFNGTSSATCVSSDRPPGFIAALYYSTADSKFIFFTHVGAHYASTTLFSVWTTTSTAHMVSENVKVRNKLTISTNPISYVSLPYSKTIETVNSTYVSDSFLGNIDCETTTINDNGALECIEKDDRIIIMDPSLTSSAFASNPIYTNIYTVEKIYRETNTKIGKISLDVSVNGYWSADDLARVYLFKSKKGYHHITECSNRGICDTDSGLCNCFDGYEGDDCSIVFTPLEESFITTNTTETTTETTEEITDETTDTTTTDVTTDE